MKKRTTKTTDPLDEPVDFTRFGRVRRNAFAGAGEPGGPSLLALWEMPQLATDALLLRRGRPGKGRRRTSVGHLRPGWTFVAVDFDIGTVRAEPAVPIVTEVAPGCWRRSRQSAPGRGSARDSA